MTSHFLAQCSLSQACGVSLVSLWAQEPCTWRTCHKTRAGIDVSVPKIWFLGVIASPTCKPLSWRSIAVFSFFRQVTAMLKPHGYVLLQVVLEPRLVIPLGLYHFDLWPLKAWDQNLIVALTIAMHLFNIFNLGLFPSVLSKCIVSRLMYEGSSLCTVSHSCHPTEKVHRWSSSASNPFLHDLGTRDDTDDPTDCFPPCSRKGSVVGSADLRNTSLLSLPKRASSETCSWRTPWHHRDTTITAGHVGRWWPCALEDLASGSVAEFEACWTCWKYLYLKPYIFIFEKKWNHSPYIRTTLARLGGKVGSALRCRRCFCPWSRFAWSRRIVQPNPQQDSLFYLFLAPRIFQGNRSFQEHFFTFQTKKVKFTLFKWNQWVDVPLLCSWLASMSIGSPSELCLKRIPVDDRRGWYWC